MVTALHVFWTAAVFGSGEVFGFALKRYSSAALAARQNFLVQQLGPEIDRVIGMNKQLAAENERLRQTNSDLRDAGTKTRLW